MKQWLYGFTNRVTCFFVGHQHHKEDFIWSEHRHMHVYVCERCGVTFQYRFYR